MDIENDDNNMSKGTTTTEKIDQTMREESTDAQEVEEQTYIKN